MQRLKLFFVIIFSACLLLACSGNNSSSTGKESVADNTASSGTTSPGDASFSATIDGTAISGNEIDEMQLTNTAFIYPATNENPQRLLFFLNSNKKGEDFYSFRFSLPDKEGTYTFTHYTAEDCHCDMRLDNNLRSADNFSSYHEDDSVTVVIDKITSTRISGTFAGRLSDGSGSKSHKSNVVVTDGKFDIPFSTGKLRPQYQ
ncbi:MAG TPA: hypothetical protein VIJ75_01455 [Hanamia sp.]